MAYDKLGREEDPPFTIKTMVVKTLWPGATATETLSQVTDRIEKKLEELPHLDFVRSYTKPGESVVFVNLKDSVRAADGAGPVVSGAQEDRRHPPQPAVGHLRAVLQRRVRRHLFASSTPSRPTASPTASCATTPSACAPSCCACRDVAKVDLIGVQDEKIYLEFSTQQMAALGIDVNALMQALQAQNAVVPSGTVDAGPERIAIRVSGEFTSEESLKAINFRSNDRFFRLSDIATGQARLCRSAAADVPLQRRAGDRPRHLDDRRRRRAGARREHQGARRASSPRDLPVGIDVHLVADQPHVVEEAVGEFTKSADGGHRHRAGGELPGARLAAGHRGRRSPFRWCSRSPSSS